MAILYLSERKSLLVHAGLSSTPDLRICYKPAMVARETPQDEYCID